MSQAEIEGNGSECARGEAHVSQETVKYLIWYCNRKMDVCGIKDREEYLPLMFRDELKNHLFRQYMNAASITAIQNARMPQSQQRYIAAADAVAGYRTAGSIMAAWKDMYVQNA